MRIGIALLFAVSIVSRSSAGAPQLEQLTRSFDDTVRPFLKSYCLGCHGESVQEAMLDLSLFTTVTRVQNDLGYWELVLSRLIDEEMPPEDAPVHPSPQESAAVVRWIQDLRRFEADRNAGDPGAVPARRLNNTEYDNTIRDLTGVDIRPTSEFPVDPANVAGFANSGESLTMSPALLNKYLSAARFVTDHLVMLPVGFSFATHPVMTDSDRDKFAVRRVIDFYRKQKTDYAVFLAAAWQYRHREALGDPNRTLDDAADSHGISHRYLSTLWDVLQDGEAHQGPIARLREQWEALPAPEWPQAAVPVAECGAIRDWILDEREKRRFSFPSVMIPQLNPTTQPGVLWKNRLIEDHRRKGQLNEEEKQDKGLMASVERFCNVFPDRFMRTERGRMHLSPEKQNKGRLLGAGFHLQVGYYRDDRPLYDLLLTDDQKSQIDQLWRELYFVTNVVVRQFQDYIYFERSEGGNIITEPEFDFARGEDRAVVSRESMAKISRLYLAAVKKRNVDEAAIEQIERYFVDQSRQIRAHQQALVEAEPTHLQALLRFADRAWRRPLAADESRQLLKFYRSLREEADLEHEEAIRDVVASILMSPFFCYRVDQAETSGSSHRLIGFSLASRLSYFLWSSMPDDELTELGRNRQLRRPNVLAGQAQRMLKDARAKALAIEFAGNWLDFRQFQNHVAVDRTKFSQFTDELRESMFQEPVRFITDWIRRDGAVRELLEAEHTFVDRNLANHYRIPWEPEAGDENGWTRIDNARDYGRGGLLPMSVFLTKNSPGLRTSPVKRGYWIVSQLLGERIPPPPPDVPDIPSDETATGDLTLRELLAKHRDIHSCAACHAKFDFAGLAFEGYDPIGQRRLQDFGGRPVDDSTVFPDGTTGNSLSGLQTYLMNQRQDQFEDNFCRKLLAYGLGRSLLLSDESVIDRMKQTIAEDGGRFSHLVEVIVTSSQFLNKRPPTFDPQSPPASNRDRS